MKCVNCDNVDMVKARLSVGFSIVYTERSSDKFFSGSKNSPVSCHVCPKCGYIALVADDPKKLI